MKEFIEQFQALELELSHDKGEFDLFALFLREGSPGVWDLLVSAPWVEEDKGEALRDLSARINQRLDSDEMSILSRIVVIDSDNPGLKALTSAINIEHGCTEIQNCNFFGLRIEHGYVVTSKRREITA